jgi:hypothetical protein
VGDCAVVEVVEVLVVVGDCAVVLVVDVEVLVEVEVDVDVVGTDVVSGVGIQLVKGEPVGSVPKPVL